MYAYLTIVNNVRTVFVIFTLHNDLDLFILLPSYRLDLNFQVTEQNTIYSFVCLCKQVASGVPWPLRILTTPSHQMAFVDVTLW